jgi:hypothetical protein
MLWTVLILLFVLWLLGAIRQRSRLGTLGICRSARALRGRIREWLSSRALRDDPLHQTLRRASSFT